MNQPPCLRILRPYLNKELPGIRKAAHVRFYAAVKALDKSAVQVKDATKDERSIEIKKRIEQLQSAGYLRYPRIAKDERALRCAEFNNRYASLKNDEKATDVVTVRGRVNTLRVASSKLAFVDVTQDGHKVQGMINFSNMPDDVALSKFKELVKVIHRGDFIALTGTPTRTSRGELTVLASALPQLLSPSLATIPLTLEDPETRIQHRHADMLVNRRVVDTLKLRSHMIQHIRNFFLEQKFLEVQTPMLADNASGATARPFVTSATEFPKKELSLRIAPELWLKRLLVGGMDRVFEIGTAFRNEGIDATHNPEFTSCEFYKSFAELEELMGMSEALISGLAKRTNELVETELSGLEALDLSHYTTPFKRISFVPGIEAGLGQKLPDLTAADATEKVLEIFTAKDLLVPSPASLPRLLDKLCSIYIEPACKAPTFITHHPACLAPLAKSFVDETTGQLVSARAELFMHEKELANMYEEENSPFAQREKFKEQIQWKDEENEALVEESYLEALEWGMPPTGGWGCGIDRLVMMMSGSPRISDVLPFGTLRNVVALGARGLTRDDE